jgi:hypothetical protein
MWHYGVTQSQHCNNDNNDDNVIRASVWFDFLGGLGFIAKTHDIWKGNVTTRSEI